MKKEEEEKEEEKEEEEDINLTQTTHRGVALGRDVYDLPSWTKGVCKKKEGVGVVLETPNQHKQMVPLFQHLHLNNKRQSDIPTRVYYTTKKNQQADGPINVPLDYLSFFF